MFKRAMLKWVLGAACVAFLVTGCESGDGDDSLSDTGSGSATVSGVLDAISNDYVPAAVQGITVDLVQDGKAILRTMTKEDGSFTFYGVPAGAFTLVFHVGDAELTRPVTVETSAGGVPAANVVLGRVKVSGQGTIDDVVEVKGEIEVAVEVDTAPHFKPSAEALAIMKEMALVKEKIAAYKKQYAFYEKQLADLNAPLSLLKAQANELEAQWQDLVSQYRSKVTQLKKAQVKVSLWQKDNPDQKVPQEMLDEVSKLEAEAASIRKQLALVEAQLKELGASIAGEEKNTALDRERLTALMERTGAKISALEAELADLQKKLKLQNLIDRGVSAIDYLEAQYASLVEQHKKAVSDYTVLDRKLSEWQKANPNQSPPQDWLDQMKKIKATIASLEVEIKSVSTQLHELKAK